MKLVLSLLVIMYMRIVTVGGGTGGSIVDAALASVYPNLTAVVTSFDNGGSSGILRKEFGGIPLGDMRRRIFAQKTISNNILEEIYNFRFSKDNSLETHSLGNLMILAATKIWGEEKGVEKICELFAIKGKVLPVTFTHAELCAKLGSGRSVLGEDLIGQTKIDKRSTKDDRKIERVYLSRITKINPKVKDSILNSEYIILCPGDFYSSLIPNFLVKGFKKVIKAAQKNGSKIIFVSNIMTKFAETNNFKLSDFVGEVEKYLGTKVDHILFNKSKIEDRLIQKYWKKEKAKVVVNDLQTDRRVREVNMLKQNGVLRHDKQLFLKAFENLVH